MFVIKIMIISSLFASGTSALSSTTYPTMDACNQAASVASGGQPQGPVYVLGCQAVPQAAPASGG